VALDLLLDVHFLDPEIIANLGQSAFAVVHQALVKIEGIRAKPFKIKAKSASTQN
jgi:hypothetical protein